MSTAKKRAVREVPRASATRESWAAAGLAAFAEGGLEALAVEPIAKRLGVTKGSFYWHFKNREALLSAALNLWESKGTLEIIEELSPLADPTARLRGLFRRVSDYKRGSPFHAALAASREPAARRVLKRATAARLAFLTRCYADLGFSARAARRHALIAYSVYLGTMTLLRDCPAELATPNERSAYTDQVIDTLVPVNEGTPRSRAPARA
jgi:AcrR family transcriptional regulator